MIRPPHALGIILCRQLAVDPATVEMSLAGTFQSLSFAQWPATAAFTAYTALQGGEGEGTIKLVISRLETEQDVYTQQKWYAVPPAHLTGHLEFRVRRCVFPAPGRYDVVLCFDEFELTRRHLDVYRR